MPGISAYITRKKPLLIHVIVWLILMVILLYQAYNNNGKIDNRFLLFHIFSIVVFYINYLYLVPKFLLQKKTSQYLIYSGILVFVPLLQSLFFEPPPRPSRAIIEQFGREPSLPEPFFFLGPILINVCFLVIGSSIKIYIEWNKNEIKKKEIETQKSKAELNFLKNQLSPHFLFNSLNSLYSLSVKKSDAAPEAIITLSELMRYMLYQTDNDYVALKEELEYIENYLKLQRLRLANDEFVSFEIRGTITNQKIRPLLLISFIENAFKYGTDAQGKTRVVINIIVGQKTLEFMCTNITQNKIKTGNNTGIGLKNTRSRLNLLYPGKHHLEVSNHSNQYKVNLKLDLSV
ncbi:hypothetical protein APR41_05335 [Salegentibacter salinarum]|uniref:Signal transduction histidine kinase internal region domain-containing protein n=2 Tax=Salegentibacter salinarum TaxID=447422 RepID=A0A2N0TSS8_9FLAO|nr:hypothetical protein APR41_05335 [Salegentibacter salinarum]SKB50009.1 Histidine kinase [Salegentibacter salinarum]